MPVVPSKPSGGPPRRSGTRPETRRRGRDRPGRAGRAQNADAALEGVDRVVHAAIASDDEADHEFATIAATEALIAAMVRRPERPRLVLISSMSIYNYASMPAGSQIDETTPLEPEPQMRDAYCRAKLSQEALARRAAQRAGLRVHALRPGVIVGPKRLRTARLGFGLGPFLVIPGGAALIPLIAVDECAALTLRATLSLPGPSDIPITSGDGGFEAINLIGRNQPSQLEYARLLAEHGWPRMILRVPLRLARLPARALWLAGLLLPTLARGVPGAMRLESFDARFKALRYSTARAEDRLGFAPERSASEIVGAASSANVRS